MAAVSRLPPQAASQPASNLPIATMEGGAGNPPLPLSIEERVGNPPPPPPPSIQELQNLIHSYRAELWEFWETNLYEENKAARLRYIDWRFIHLPEEPNLSYIHRLSRKLERSSKWASSVLSRLQEMLNLEDEIRQELRRYARYLVKEKAKARKSSRQSLPSYNGTTMQA